MKKFFDNRNRVIAVIAFFLATALYAWAYALAPFPESLNAFILNGATVFAALTVTWILVRVTFYFKPNESPFIIWAAFAFCAGLWTIAEGIWGYLYMTVGEVPVFSMADVLWVAGYLALTASLLRQYNLVFFNQKYTIRWAAIGVWMGIVLIIETILLITGSEAPLEDFFRYFYLFADSAVGLSALFLVLAFRGRALAIPWLTISSFAVTDFLYIQLTESGVYDYVMSGISIGLVADTLYVAAYLVVAWGVLEQYFLLKSHADHIETEN